ncbi:MAG TPA: ATP-binding protein [Sulfuriferula sp.]|nr:ATP-binding protein [Sulfuriferula sp.]
MNSSHEDTDSYPVSSALILRSLRLPALVLGSVVILALALMTLTAWRAETRIGTVQLHMQNILALQALSMHIEHDYLRLVNPQAPLPAHVQQALDRQLAAIIAADHSRVADTPAVLNQLRQLLARRDASHDTLLSTLAQIHDRITRETSAHAALVSDVERTARFEFNLALTLVVVLPLLALAILYLLRHRVQLPLRDLSWLMQRLSQQDYASAPTAHADPLIKPLLLRYNHLVNRLAELEAEHQDRETLLEQQVRAASTTLLTQQQHLAQAEKLASVGEVAASIAHELRNPLSGIQMALTNLRRETESADHAARLDMILDEINRITRLLNGLLDQARHRPEAASEVNLAELCSSLASLARYQLPPGVTLVTDVPGNLHCVVAADGLRQALLNLILNARNALGNSTGIIRLAVQPRGDSMEISVTDSGSGFSDTLLSHGPRPFISGHESGTGLGLAITRRFVNDLGGRITLDNPPTGGARVTLYLPCTAHA